MIDRHVMPTSEVARALGLSVDRVRQLDEQLKPVRRPNNRRVYDPAVVEAYMRTRRGA